MSDEAKGLEALKYVPGDLYRGFRHETEHDRASLGIKSTISALGAAGATMMLKGVDWADLWTNSDKLGASVVTATAVAFTLAPTVFDETRQIGQAIRRARDQEQLANTFD